MVAHTEYKQLLTAYLIPCTTISAGCVHLTGHATLLLGGGSCTISICSRQRCPFACCLLWYFCLITKLSTLLSLRLGQSKCSKVQSNSHQAQSHLPPHSRHTSPLPFRRASGPPFGPCVRTWPLEPRASARANSALPATTLYLQGVVLLWSLYRERACADRKGEVRLAAASEEISSFSSHTLFYSLYHPCSVIAIDYMRIRKKLSSLFKKFKSL